MQISWLWSLGCEACAVYMARRHPWIAAMLAYDLLTSLGMFLAFSGQPGSKTYADAWILKTAGLTVSWVLAAWYLMRLEVRSRWGSFLAHVLAPGIALGCLTAVTLASLQTKSSGSLDWVVTVAMSGRRSLAGGLSALGLVVAFKYWVHSRPIALPLAFALYLGLQAWGMVFGTSLRPEGWDPKDWYTAINTANLVFSGCALLGLGYGAGQTSPARAGYAAIRGRDGTSATAHQPRPERPRRIVP